MVSVSVSVSGCAATTAGDARPEDATTVDIAPLEFVGEDKMVEIVMSVDRDLVELGLVESVAFPSSVRESQIAADTDVYTITPKLCELIVPISGFYEMSGDRFMSQSTHDEKSPSFYVTGGEASGLELQNYLNLLSEDCSQYSAKSSEAYDAVFSLDGPVSSVKIPNSTTEVREFTTTISFKDEAYVYRNAFKIWVNGDNYLMVTGSFSDGRFDTEVVPFRRLEIDFDALLEIAR
jgi:hypothetical protein